MNIVSIALAFLLGVLIFQISSELPSAYSLLVLPVIFVIVKKHSKLLLPLIVVIGYFWTYLFASIILYPQMSAKLERKELQVNGFVSEVKSINQQYVRFIFNIDKNSIKHWQESIPQKVILSWYYPKQELKKFQTCKLVVRLKQHWRYANPGSIDSEKTMFLRGIGARGYVRSGECQFDNTVQFQTSLRQKWIDRFGTISADFKYSNLMEALTFGFRENINQAQWQVLRETGTSHLLAISGLHISAISFVVFFVVTRLVKCSAILCEWMPAQKIAAIFALITAIFYAYLAGFSLPTQRALIMVSVGLVAILLCRPVVSFSVFSTALLLVLIVNPMAVLTAGFWMSFSAVLFIFIVLKSTEGKHKLTRIILIQCYLGAALFPVGLLFFSQASLISPIVNLFAIPIVSFVLLPLLLISQLLFLLNLEISLQWFLHLDQLFDWFWLALEKSANFPYASFELYPTLFGVLMYELGLFLLIQPRGLPGKHLAWVFLSALFFIKESELQVDQMRMTVLDVGQGLSVLIETANHSLLYDAGPSSFSGFNTGQVVVLPFMKKQGLSYIDLAIVSHNDNDHAGGIHGLLRENVLKRLMVSNRAELYEKQEVEFCRAGDEWHWDSVTFRVLHPPAKWASNDNNRSCVLQIIHAAGVVLLPGDIEKSTENWLVGQYGDKLASDLMLVPHHGSKTSSSYRILERVHPQTAVFSAGYQNRYGFPHATITQRYQEVGAQIVDTTREGAVTFLFDPETGLNRQPGYRLRHKRYWHSTQEELTNLTK